MHMMLMIMDEKLLFSCIYRSLYKILIFCNVHGNDSAFQCRGRIVVRAY